MGLRMRTAFVLASLLGTLLFVLGVWAFGDSYLRVARLSELQRLTGMVTSDGRRLSLHSHNLLLDDARFLRRQWRTLHDALEHILDTHPEVFRPYRREVANVRHYLEILKAQLEAYLALGGRPDGAAAPTAARLRASQIALRIAELQTALDELEQAIRQAVDGELGTAGQGLLAKFTLLFGLYVVAGVGAWWFFYLRMQRPLSALVAGIRRIHGGDRQFRPRHRADDEIGAVVQALNTLLDREQALTADLAAGNRLFEVISRVQAQFIREPEPTVMFDKLLQDVIALTDSEFGFIGDVLRDAQGNDYLKNYAFSNIAWDDATRRFYEDNRAGGFVFKNLDTLFGSVITGRAPVLANDPAHDPRSAGTPPGHPELRSFLGIPVWYGERLVGEIGLANRPGGYDRALLDHIQPVVEACGRIIVARWERDARREAETQLRDYKHHLEELVATRTRELAKAKQAADEANHAKSAFLANMSHELRTPLNAILGFAQLMQRDRRIPAEERTNLATINQSGRHLLALIDEVLEISRIESGRIELRPQVVDLAELLEMLLASLGPRARAKGLALHLEGAADLPHHLYTDPAKLRQILFNLLSNAVKYTRTGEVTLSAAAQQVAGEGQETLRLTFEIRDTGIGIAARDLDKVFLPFYQTEQGARQGEGTGLGLALCREYVELMGGRIGVESTPGSGSLFRVQLPVREAEAPPQRPPTGPVAGLAAGQPAYRILIAEDQPDNRRLILQLLEQSGFRGRTAGNGREAVALFRRWHPDLILMDIRMPEMDGCQATRTIRALPEGGRLPIVALTASVLEQERPEILAAGCNEILAKPLDREALLTTLARLLDAELEFLAPEPAAPDTTAPPSLEGLDPALVDALREAALELDTEALGQAVAAIARQAPALAAQLTALADGYQFDRILEACDLARAAGETKNRR